MRKASIVRFTAIPIALSALAATATVRGAQAHEVRFVASYGNNHNLCTREAPCRLLQRGINRTPAGGELIVLDSGDFGEVASIGQSITISAIGVSAALGGPITINAADATVRLRGLRLNGASADPAAHGIEIVAAAAVSIEDCEIQGFGGAGIASITTADPNLSVSASVSRNNGLDGLLFATGSGARLAVDTSRFERNGNMGLYIVGPAAVIARTVVSGNAGHGIDHAYGSINVVWTTAEHNSGYGYFIADGEATLEHSAARGNGIGIGVQGSGIARISRSVVTNNVTGLSVSAGASLRTRVNNVVSGNATDVAGVVTPLGGI